MWEKYPGKQVGPAMRRDEDYVSKRVMDGCVRDEKETKTESILIRQSIYPVQCSEPQTKADFAAFKMITM